MCVISTVVERSSINERQYYQEVAKISQIHSRRCADSSEAPSHSLGTGLGTGPGMTNSINQRFLRKEIQNKGTHPVGDIEKPLYMSML